MKIFELNHVALHVSDLDASCRFYRDVLRLEQLPRPGFDFPGAWFRLGAEQELHLIGDRAQPVSSSNRGNHFALRTDNLDAWEKHFSEISFTSKTRKVRPDGAGQMFVKDPDGHVIELCVTDTIFK